MLARDGRFIASCMPMSAVEIDGGKDENGEQQATLSITGSYIFEDEESGEMNFSIFRSKDSESNEYYP